MRRFVLLLASCACLVPVTLSAQATPQAKRTQTASKPATAPMTNQDVAKMVASKLSDEIVIEAIRRAKTTSFDVSPDGLVSLKNAGVSDAVLAVMLNPTGAGAEPPKNTPTPVPAVETLATKMPAAVEVALHAGTPVKVCLTKALTSETAKVGTMVNLEVAEDVLVDAKVVIKRGAEVSGKLTVATKQLMTRAGKLEVTVEAVEAVNGAKVRLTGSTSAQGGRGLVRADEATMPAETEFTATVNEDCTVALPPPPAATTTVASREPAVARTVNAETTAASSDDPAVVHDAGIYVEMGDASAHNLVPLEPTTFSQGRTGNALLSGFTYGIKKMKYVAVVRGRKGNLRIHERQPVFYFYFEKKGSGLSNTGWFAGASGPNEFILAKLTQTDKGRELIVGEFGLAGSDIGPRPEDSVDLVVERLAPGIYRVTPRTRLDLDGEYCLFYSGAASMMAPAGAGGKLFDFGIDRK